jgi:hypothetical protein
LEAGKIRLFAGAQNRRRCDRSDLTLFRRSKG